MSFIYIANPGISSPGTSDTDTIFGSNKDDTLNGAGGNDTLYGYPASDVAVSDGNDLLNGGDGIDHLYSGTGNDTFDGGSGFDWIWASSAIHHIDLSLKLDLGNLTATRTIRKFDANGSLIGTDQFSGIENFGGTSNSDSFFSADPSYAPQVGYRNFNISGGGGSDTFTQIPFGVAPFSPSWTAGGSRSNGMGVFYFWVQPDANNKGIDVKYVGNKASIKYFNSANGQVAGVDTLTNITRIGDSNYDDVFDFSQATDNGVGFATRPDLGFVSHHYPVLQGGSDTVIGNGATILLLNGAFNLTSLNGAGATLDLSKPSANLSNLSGFGTVTYSNLGGVVGTKFNDYLIGGGTSSDFREIFRGAEGNDTIDGAGGYDIANYDASTGSVTVVLAAGTAVGNESIGSDTLLHVEGIRGSDFDDILDSRGFGDTSPNAGSMGSWNLIAPEGGNDLIYGNGNTAVSYVNSWVSVKVDLSSGADALNVYDKTNPEYALTLGKDSFMGGVNSATGSSQSDLMIGTDTTSSGGEERFQGMAGNDTLVGNGGMDWANYFDSPTAITADLRKSANQVSDGWSGIDTLQGIEGLRGSYADDVIRGSDSQWVNEAFDGMQGADSIDGGQGFNSVSFIQNMQGVTVWLAANSRTLAPGVGVADKVKPGFTGVALDGWGDIDQLANIDGVEGSKFNDLIVGNDAGNRLTGRNGNDTLDGGAGFDWAEFNYYPSNGVTVNLSTQSASDGDGGTDRLLSIEGVLGSQRSDQITGDALANILDGNAGNDTLDGAGGDDVLKGQDGNDVLISGLGRDYLLGGAGTDTLKLTASGIWSGSYWAQNDFLLASGVQTAAYKLAALSGLNRFESVSNGGADYDTLELTSGNDALALDDVLTQMNSEAATELGRLVGIELINAGDGNDMVDLSSARFVSSALKVDGGAGNDVLWGGAGADQLLGGSGNDSLLGAAGNDTLTGGAGADSFLFALGSGQDTISDFSVASGDKVRLLGGTASGATVSYTSNNADTLLSWNGQQVTLTGVQLTGTTWFEYSA